MHTVPKSAEHRTRRRHPLAADLRALPRPMPDDPRHGQGDAATCARTWSSPTAAGGADACSCARCVDCPIIIYCEYYFANSHRDISYRIDLPPAEPAPFFPRCINAPTLATLVDCDAGYSATHWQKQSFPATLPSQDRGALRRDRHRALPPRARARQIGGTVDPGGHARGHVRVARSRVDPRIRPLHEGRRPDLPGALGCGLRRGRRRGNPLRLGQAAHGLAQFQGVGAGARASYDLARFIFMGRVLPEQLAAILRLSDLHIYLTAPFVLSWSLLDAMASGCVVLASDVRRCAR